MNKFNYLTSSNRIVLLIVLEWLIVIVVAFIIDFFIDNFSVSLISTLIMLLVWHYPMVSKFLNFKLDKEDLIQKIIEGAKFSSDGIIICNEKGNIWWFNNKANDFFNNILENSSNISLLELIPYADFKDYLNSVDFDTPITLEINPDIFVKLSIIKFSNNNLLIFIKNSTDKQFLEDSRKFFFANVSHELRIPLTVLRGYIELLENERKAQKYEKSDLKPYRNMHTQVNRLLSMVEQLMKLSKLQNDPFFEEKTLVDMPDIIYSIYDELLLNTEVKQKITLYLDDELFVYGYNQLLRDVVSNLIYNAIEHNNKNTQIIIKWEKQFAQGKKYALFSIEDNGVGIAKEHIARITERFYRVDSARNRNVNKNIGSGLGLSIVEHVLIKHDSTLVIKSEEGKGSCFKFSLPIYQEDSN